MLNTRIGLFSRVIISQKLKINLPSCSLKFWSRKTDKIETEVQNDEKLDVDKTESEVKVVEEINDDGVYRPWKDPWAHAIDKGTNYSDFEEAPVDWSYVERLILSHKLIPEMPKVSGVTPSGWRPPLDPPPDLPYYIRRKRDHQLPLFLERRRDELNPNTLEFSYVELVKLKEVNGDVFACEKDLKLFLEKELGHSVATHVDELKGCIRIKGADRSLIEKFVFEQGF